MRLLTFLPCWCCWPSTRLFVTIDLRETAKFQRPPLAALQVPDVPLAGQLMDLLSNAVVIKAAVDHWVVNGRLRVRLGPLLDGPPILGGVQGGKM
mgnify:CR=1 FL=1